MEKVLQQKSKVFGRQMMAIAIAVLIAGLSAPQPVSAGQPDQAAVSKPSILGAKGSTAIPDRYLVKLKDTASLRQTAISQRAQTLSQHYRMNVRSVYGKAWPGFAVGMSEAEALRLAADPEVDYVEQQHWAFGADTQENAPWHLDRVDQRFLPLNTAYNSDLFGGNGVTAYVVDSGVRLTHQEFGGRARDGWDFVGGDPVANDCHGHGTHVAGILGGSSVGVAKRVRIVAVKVLDCGAVGTDEQILNGVKWVLDNAIKPAVMNMSIQWLCTPCAPGTGQAVADMLAAVIASGVVSIVAAGNSNVEAVAEPLVRAPGSITVGAVAKTDQKTSISNFGSSVTLWAPGGEFVAGGGVLSADGTNDAGYVERVGTSMAAPNVAGIAALILNRPGWAGKSPNEVKAELLRLSTVGVLGGLGLNSPNRLAFSDAPPASSGSSIAAAPDESGSIRLFGVNYLGQLFNRVQATGTINTWGNWAFMGEGESYSVSAENDGSASIELFNLSRNGQLIFHRTQSGANFNGWTAPSQLPGFLSSTAVARNSQGRLEVFGTNDDGDGWESKQLAGHSNSWGNWSPFGLANVRLRDVAAERNANNVIEVFALDSTDRIWHRWETAPSSGTYTPWVQLDGFLTAIAAARNKDGLIELAGSNRSGQAFHRSAVLGVNNWLPWSVFGLPPSGPGLIRSMAAETNVSGQVSVFAVDSDHNIWHAWQTAADSSNYTPWIVIDGLLRPQL